MSNDLSNHPRNQNVHGFYRELFTKLLAINPAKAQEIEALPITPAEKITLLEKELQ